MLSFFIKYYKQKAFERRRNEGKRLYKISILEQQLLMLEYAEVRPQLNDAQNNILSSYEYKLKGTIIRSIVRWVEERQV